VQINIILILFKTTPMHLAHSALRTNSQNGKTELNDKELQQRLDAYNTACQKYRTEIAAIQKYLPGWMPGFEAKGKRRKVSAEVTPYFKLIIYNH
jgi:hypothetical protein